VEKRNPAAEAEQLEQPIYRRLGKFYLVFYFFNYNASLLHFLLNLRHACSCAVSKYQQHPNSARLHIPLLAYMAELCREARDAPDLLLWGHCSVITMKIPGAGRQAF